VTHLDEDDEYEDVDEGVSLAGDRQQVFDLSDPDHMDLLFQYAMDKYEELPLNGPKLQGLAKQLAAKEAEERAARGEPAKGESSSAFEALVGAIEHFHFEPADPGRRHGEYMPSFVDQLLAHQEEDAATLDAPPPPLSSVEQWFSALELPETSPMRSNARFVRVLTELSEPKYTQDSKKLFVRYLTDGLMVDPARAGYVGREPVTALPFVPQQEVPTAYYSMVKGNMLKNALASKLKPSVSFVPVPQQEQDPHA